MRRKFVIYQLLPRLFGNTNDVCIPNSFSDVNGCGKLADITPEVIKSIKELGCTHIWFTGILEHATQTDNSAIGIPPDPSTVVKGKAGSPYAIKDYYDVAPDLAINPERRIEEFTELAERCHSLNVKVLIDFVPNHLSRVYKSDSNPGRVGEFGENDNQFISFSPENNFYYLPGETFVSPAETNDIYFEIPAKATGNDCFRPDPSVNDWYDTVKLNYGVNYQTGESFFLPVPDTWVKMLDILQFWCERGVDGFRCDMAEMVPSEFWSYSISAIKAKYPETQFIAEIYNPGSYRKYLGSGFDYLYDKVGLYDTLKDIVKGFKPASEITSCWQTLSDIQDSMLNFLENHDEQRVASPFFAGNPAKALPALAAGLLLNRAPYMIYSGQELGEPGMVSEGFSNCDGRTSIFDYWSVKTIRDWFKGEYDKKIRDSYSFLLNLSLSEKAFSLGDTFDLQYANTDNSSYCSGNLYSFIRKFQNELIIVVVNFSSSDFSVKLNIPKHLFEYFDIKDGNECESFDLQFGKRKNLVFSSEIQFETFVPECSYSLVKLLLQ